MCRITWRLIAGLSLLFSGLPQSVTIVFAQTELATESAAQPETHEISPDFTASVLSGQAPLTVEFDASATQADTSAVYRWEFGDTAGGEGQLITHIYERPGHYLAQLIVESGNTFSTKAVMVIVDGDEAPFIVQRPFSIVEEEVGEGDYIRALLAIKVYPDSTSTVPAHNPAENRINYYSLVTRVNGMGIGIAGDVIIPGIKDEVRFDAANNVRALALQIPEFYQVPDDVLATFYQAFSEHPDFSLAVEKVKAFKGQYTFDGKTEELIHKVALETAREILAEQGYE